MIRKHRLLPLLVALVALAFCAALSRVEANGPTVGVLFNEPESFTGYTLFAPLQNTNTFLIDNQGRLIHSWPSDYIPALHASLLDDGSLIRPELLPNPSFNAGGAGGRVERLGWDGTLLWQFEYSSSAYRLHHDVKVLPNGNILMLAWEYKSAAQAAAAGRDPAQISQGQLWPESIIEVQPTGASGGTIVWEWHSWDHLIQDFDNSKDNFGPVADHPELIDINFLDLNDPGVTPSQADWMHANAVDYNPALDQIVVSVRDFSEIWVIDHSTTTAEASGHSGGSHGKGGDLLYRWGNPQTYRAGAASDESLFHQHNAAWITPGLAGAGDILVFNNGSGRPSGDYSSVDEITTPVDGTGNYPLTPGMAYGPVALTWTYSNPGVFYSAFIGGAERLPNGNTLICSGVSGIFYEVTPAGQVVWQYVNPVNGAGPIAQGTAPVSNLVFRAHRYAPDYSGLAGHDLTPGAPIETVDSDGDGLSNLDELKIYGTNSHVADTDGDGLSDGAEVNTYHTDPLNPDTDSDGCSDGREVGNDPKLGGLRDPLNFWDYFDTPDNNGVRDHRIHVDDVLRVIRRYRADDANGTAAVNRNSDPLSVPPPTGYHPAFDRTVVGPQRWDLGSPDGKIRVDDLVAMMNQYNHDCA